MKTRNGFVSNSSTTSFCIFGACVSKDELMEAARKIQSDISDDYSAAELLAEEIGLEYNIGYESEYYYFGRNPRTFKDDETGAQFKESVKNATEKFFPGVQVAGMMKHFMMDNTFN